MKHLWFEKLTIPKLVWIVVTGGVHSQRQVRYATATTLARRVAGLFKGSHIKEVILEKGVRDENGRALIYRIEEDSAQMINRAFAAAKDVDDWIPKDLKAYREEWIRLLKSTCDDRHVKKTLTFLYCLEYFYQRQGLDSNARVEIWVENAILARFVMREVKLKFKSPHVLKVWPALRFSLLFFPLPGLLVYTFTLALRAQWRGKPIQNLSLLREGQGCIFEEYISNLFHRFPEAGHLYWFKPSGIKSQRVVVYCDRKDSPCNAKAQKEIESQGMNWLDLSDVSRHLIAPLKTFWESFRQVPGLRQPNEFSRAMRLYAILYRFQLEGFREVFRRYRCKVLHQHQEFWPPTLLKAIALRMEDGIFVWNHWSVDHYPVSYFHWGFADLVFSWGDYNDGYFHAHNFSYKYLLQTGLIAGEGFTPNDREEGMRLREKFNEKFVIVLFDNSHGPTCQNSTDSVLFFYERILNMVFRHSRWAIVTKSKGRAFDRLPYREAIHGIMKHLEDEGRCRVLKGEQRVAPAAAAADLCVCYTLNSAGVIAALYGKRAIYWDLPGALEHPLYSLGNEGKLIFQTEGEIEDALEAVAAGDQEIGDHSECLHLFDSFLDEDGPKRAGRVIAEFLEVTDQGLNRDLALARAVSHYKEQYGEEKVSTPGAVREHLGERLWGDKRSKEAKLQSCKETAKV